MNDFKMSLQEYTTKKIDERILSIITNAIESQKWSEEEEKHVKKRCESIRKIIGQF